MDSSLTSKLFTLEKLIKKYISFNEVVGTPLNITQIRILRYLFYHENENVIQKDLEKETQLNKASITGTLDSLEEKGLIIRVQAKDDKRKNYIQFTDKANSLKTEYNDLVKEINRIMANNISDQELEALSTTIDKIIENIKLEFDKNEINP